MYEVPPFEQTLITYAQGLFAGKHLKILFSCFGEFILNVCIKFAKCGVSL